jgi:hypothetical protein
MNIIADPTDAALLMTASFFWPIPIDRPSAKAATAIATNPIFVCLLISTIFKFNEHYLSRFSPISPYPFRRSLLDDR